jgi:hypothetical protein
LWWSCIQTESQLTTLVVTGTDCIGSCKSIYHMITTTTAHNNMHVLSLALNWAHATTFHLIYQFILTVLHIIGWSKINENLPDKVTCLYTGSPQKKCFKKTDHHDIPGILLKVVLSIKSLTLHIINCYSTTL